MTEAEIRAALAHATERHKAGQLEAAIAAYRQVLDVRPNHLDALTLLASAFRARGDLQAAIEIYDRLALADPPRAEFWFNRGNALNDSGRHDEARASYLRSLEIDGSNATVHANLAIAEAKLGDIDGSIESYRRALALDPDHRVATLNLGNALSELGEWEEAERLLRKTVRSWPDMAEGHYNLALQLLRRGDYANGFAEYEWRWGTADFFARPNYRGIPVWAGEPLDGRRLVVHAEQGLGDVIQFSRLVGVVRSICADVVFHVPPKLERLLCTLPYDVKVASEHGASDADFQIPLLSLMHRLKLTLGSVPPQPTYLAAEPEAARRWADRLRLDGKSRTIGLVWQGNPKSPAERGRSLPDPEMLRPFSELDGTRLFALQKLPDEALETGETPSGWRVRGLTFTLVHPGPDLDDGPDAFIDTAAIMQGLDLVISVCTAPLHLGGALGRPTIALLRRVPDWRWLTEREDTPWYPSMRLVRQRHGEAGYEDAIARAVEIARRTLFSASP